eukprot:355286-Chlamydomonas_euryale.AAC.2
MQVLVAGLRKLFVASLASAGRASWKPLPRRWRGAGGDVSRTPPGTSAARHSRTGTRLPIA